jgi:hypothetical protein
MKQESWTTIKELITSSMHPGERFVTIINEHGLMSCANASMKRSLDLDDPRRSAVNFFDLVHPAHLGQLRQTISNVNVTR